MFIVNKALSLYFFLIITLSACSSHTSCDDISKEELPYVKIEIERLESVILELKTEAALVDFVSANPVVSEVFLRSNEYPSNEIFYKELLQRFNNPYLDTLKTEVENEFKDISWLEEELSGAFSHLKYYYPDIQIPVVKTVATGFDHDLHVTDSLIIIGLDYYMGKGAKYRPQGIYDYILKRYEKKFIVPSIMLLYGISSDFNSHNKEDNTVLSDMISYGKSFYFAKKMLPCTPDSTLIWYDQKEIEGINENQEIVWAHFIEKGLLFETSHLVKKKYLDERPKTFEIGTECPPRVATWLGWQIVKKYSSDKPKVSLQELMELSDAKAIFDESKYRPN